MGRAYLPEHWVREPKATFGVKALAGVLSSYAQGEHGAQDVWPSPATVAEALGATARHVQNLSAEGETLGWWTRIHERNRNGGVMLTWRLHFPEFSTNRSPTELERNGSSVGGNHSVLMDEAERKPNGSPTEAQRNHSSDGRYKGTKVIPITPTASALAVAEPVELELKAQKAARKEPDAKQLRAIENRRLATQAMRDWNTIMGAAGNAMIPKLDHAHIAVLSTASRLVRRIEGDDNADTALAGLMKWAVAKSPWYGMGAKSGGERSPHQALRWCSAGHFATVHAAYMLWAEQNHIRPLIVLETQDAA